MVRNGFLYVVGVMASSRKGMNTDTLVDRVLEGAKSVGASTEKIYLNDLETSSARVKNKKIVFCVLIQRRCKQICSFW